MESLIRNWDGETVIVHYDKQADAWIFIAIHSTRLGPASGGTRMKTYPDASLALRDALKLSAAMTYKYAAAGFPQGGAKAVIAIPHDFDPAERPSLLRRYGKLIKQLGGLYRTGPDIGTSSADMDIIAETGAPYVHARTPEAGGKGESGGPTALGVFCAIQATVEFLFGDSSLSGRRILVQGAGGVGKPLIERLRGAGAEVLFSDVAEGIIHHFRDEVGLEFVPPESIFDTPCDVFSPCAQGGVLNKNTIPRLQCRAVVGGANLQVAEPEDLDRLRARGILYAPDFVVNIGGAMAITGMESMGWSLEEAEDHVIRVRSTLRRVYEQAKAEGITTDAAARRLANANLKSGAE